jgi:hypothetical protein
MRYFARANHARSHVHPHPHTSTPVRTHPPSPAQSRTCGCANEAKRMKGEGRGGGGVQIRRPHKQHARSTYCLCVRFCRKVPGAEVGESFATSITYLQGHPRIGSGDAPNIRAVPEVDRMMYKGCEWIREQRGRGPLYATIPFHQNRCSALFVDAGTPIVRVGHDCGHQAGKCV